MSALLAAGLVLAIDGAPAMRWSIECELRKLDRVDRLSLQGEGPMQRRLDATGADCLVLLHAGQRLTVMLVDGQSSRARSTVVGAGSKVRLRQGRVVRTRN